ncbi:hypothetical protein CUU52_00010 [Pectobacterium polaris]|nr:hypothetical protein [Pectobacterium polaris]
MKEFRLCLAFIKKMGHVRNNDMIKFKPLYGSGVEKVSLDIFRPALLTRWRMLRMPWLLPLHDFLQFPSPFVQITP